MGYRRGLPRTGADSERKEEAGREGGEDSSSRAAGENEGPDDGRPATGSSPPKSRRRRPWLRVLFALFLIVEAVVLYVVNEYSPVFVFEITSVTVTGEDGVTTVVGNNPDLLYPITLAGETCGVPEMAGCVTEDPLEETLATVCCSELLDPDSPGPEEAISSLAAFSYAVVIPALILIMRGFLLGRLWTVRPMRDAPFCTRGAQSEAAWGKRRWHLRVGFFALDAFLGLFAAVVTASLFSTVAKVTCGRPRPNYFALQFYTEHTANGLDFEHWSTTSWPSGHAATTMSGLVFLSYVLWRDLGALVMWRRRAHPRLSLVLAILGGFAVGALPMSAILIGITRIREYWHRPDDVLVGFVIGLAAAHWSFQFFVLMPFRHEIGSPDWKKDPRWLEDEEDEWEEEEELLRLCGWTRGFGKGKKKGYPRIGTSSGDAVEKAPNIQTEPPVRVTQPDDGMGKLDFSPV
eukprot:g11764.t1